MFTTVMNPTSRVVIAGRIAEWRRRTSGQNELIKLNDCDLSDLPFGREQAREEAARWFWQR